MSRFFKSECDMAAGPLVASSILVGLLFFVWPIPRTISLRDLLLVACLGLFAWQVYRNRRTTFPWHRLRVPFGLYLALSIWIVFVALVISDETAWALGEIKGQWLKATVALVAGGLFGVTTLDNQKTFRIALIVMGVALLLHVLYVDYQALHQLWSFNAVLIRATGLTEQPDKSNYLTNTLLYLLLAEVLVRIIVRRRFLPIGNIALVIIVAFVLLSEYAEGVRNGIAELIVVLSLAVVLMMRASDRRQRLAVAGIALVLVAIAVVLGYLNMQKDARWRTLLETVPIAFDTDNKGWIRTDQPQPKLASGQTVDSSNYTRLARMKGGMELALESPWGVGFGRNAFGHAVMKKYGVVSSHSHSGFVDMAIGTGFPGLLLWLGFLGSLFALGWRCFRQTADYRALALLFVVTGYGTRMVLDSIVRDHMLQMFLFLAAFLAVSSAARLGSSQAAAAAPPA